MVSVRLQKDQEVSYDFVVPYVHSGDGGKELKVALSMLKNVGDWSGKVWIIGDYESWFEDLAGLTYLPCRSDGNKFHGIQTALLKACKHPDVSEQFYYSNDDIFITSPTPHIPPLYKSTWAEDDYYGNTVQETKKYLMSHNIVQGDEPLNYEPHAPLPVVKADFKVALEVCLEHAKTRIPLQVRTIYGNMFAIGGELFEDVKSMDGEKVAGDIISTGEYQDWLKDI